MFWTVAAAAAAAAAAAEAAAAAVAAEAPSHLRESRRKKTAATQLATPQKTKMAKLYPVRNSRCSGR